MNILTYKGYHGHFDYDAETNLFQGEVLDLSDIITFQGHTLEELKRGLRDAIEHYLEFCDLAGQTPEAPVFLTV